MLGISIISLIILLGILIFVHEFGHFIVAKSFGVGVLKFSLGFGHKLVGKKIGETNYLISWIPLGGYVKLLGDAEGETLSPEDEKRSFLNQTVWKRMGIVLAGPVFNLLLALVVFFGVYLSGVPALTARIGDIQTESAAAAAGLRAGDTLISIAGQRVTYWDDIARAVETGKGTPLALRIDRGGTVFDIQVTPRRVKGKNLFGEEVSAYKIGISPSGQVVTKRLGPVNALAASVSQTWAVTKLTVISIVKLIDGTLSAKTLGGPILIAQIAGVQAKEGVVPFLLFMALLSINLAVLNLLPIPVLDGGHLLFYLIELVFRRPVSLKWRERAQQVGFALLIMLMIWVFMMDVDRLHIKLLDDFARIFTMQP
ncbi:MAG: RIP metalloprotease RseP [Syntrophales bacterium]